MKSKVMDLKNLYSSDMDTREPQIQKLLQTDTKSPDYRKYITELLYSYISKN